MLAAIVSQLQYLSLSSSYLQIPTIAVTALFPLG